MRDKIFVWSHMDLDGVVAYMVLKWYYNKKVPAKFTTPQRFREDFATWSKDNFDKYDRIYVLDLDITDSKDLVDFDKVVVMDHHGTHVADYKHAKNGVKECSSAAKLVFKVFSQLPNANFTEPQKKLVALADDYDSYTLKSKFSMDLNVLLFESQHKPYDFIRDFEEGFSGFNQLQKNVIALRHRTFNRIIKDLQIYHGSIKIQDKERYVLGTFAPSCTNEVADFLLKQYRPDLVFVVNAKSEHVSLRRPKDGEVDVSKVAQVLCEGGGHDVTAGGKLTDKFLQFTKFLTLK